MFAVIGFLVVVGSVLGGFSIAGGKIPALFHVSEIVVICGTALGTIIVSSPPSTLKALSKQVPGLLKPSSFTRVLYLDTLRFLFELFQMAQREGMVAIEDHIENPEESALFKKYPTVLAQHHPVVFLCDSLRLVLMGSIPPHDLDAMMEMDLEVHHEQESQSVGVLQRVSDALPGIGIVAAVLGIVVTMGAISGPIESIGEHVAAALTGTFLGVLLAYGFTSPLATALENRQASEARYYAFLKESIVALAKGTTPIIAVEFARRSIYADVRPAFSEMEEAFQALKAARSAETAQAA